MNTKIRSILGELNRRLATLYGERLRGVYLFGSYARDEANEDSDADVLIVLDKVDNYSREIDTTSEVTSELSLEYGITLSRVFATEEQWRTGRTNFIQNLREEAVPA
ncbi:MAG: nucleotidyltransferase domain-containing protein [Candidatus Methylomirabilia bacterium]